MSETPRHAWIDELRDLADRVDDGHRSHAGCIGGLFVWVLLLTGAVGWLIWAMPR